MADLTVTIEQNGVTVSLPSKLALQHAEELRTLLLEALESSLPTTIDASGVTRISTAAIQVIEAGLQASDLISVKGPSEQFLAAISDIGFRSAFAVGSDIQ